MDCVSKVLECYRGGKNKGLEASGRSKEEILPASRLKIGRR
jgi:hypothetical protein